MNLPQDIFSFFGTCFRKHCVPIFSLPDFETYNNKNNNINNNNNNNNITVLLIITQ